VLAFRAVSNEEKIAALEEFRDKLSQWRNRRDPAVRTFINQNTVAVRREVLEAGCFHTVTVGPPPTIGGLVMESLDPFTMLFDPPYGRELTAFVVDMIDRTIGVLRASSEPSEKGPKVQVDLDVQKGHAERIDEPQSNDRITDRILESIRKAEYVIVDVTKSKPNVFYEAGYAYGIGKTPIYVARHGTQIEFDLKDYPVIFFKNMKELKDSLEKAASRAGRRTRQISLGAGQGERMRPMRHEGHRGCRFPRVYFVTSWSDGLDPEAQVLRIRRCTPLSFRGYIFHTL
jgi:hypothetical protein